MEVIIVIYVIDWKLNAFVQEIETLNARLSPACWLKPKIPIFYQHGLTLLSKRKVWMGITFLQKLCHHVIKNSLFSYTNKYTTQIY